MSYRSEFGQEFELGFDVYKFPQLNDKSWHNDVCPSFYFKIADQYFVLWVDFEDPARREYASDRYTIVSAENYDCEESPDIVCGDSSVEIFKTEDVSKIKCYLEALFSGNGPKSVN